MRYTLQLVAVCALVSWGAALCSQAQPPMSKSERVYANKERKVLWGVGQRHVRLGMWARKVGLNAQATEQFMVVREASDSINTGGDFLLSLQRQHGDAFWKQRQRVSKSLIREYEKRAKNAIRRARKDRFGLAQMARKLKLRDRAKTHYERLLRSSEEAIEFNEKGAIPLDCGVIPADYAESFRADSVRVDGNPQVRDAFLAEAKEVAEVFAVESPALRVRSELGTEHAAKLHKMLSALLPHLEAAVEGTPVRRLEVFVFETDASFQAYLRRIGYGDAKVHGLMDPQTFTALVSAEKRAPAVVQAIAMHELTHLYDYAVSRAVFPAWYTEAFAETYGGVGTFQMAGDALEVGGKMPGWRIAPLLAEGGRRPLAELVGMSRGRLLSLPVEEKVDYYAQAWAFLRYLRQGAGDEVATKLRVWEDRCRGAAVGAQIGQPRIRNASETAALFDAAFGEQLEEFDRGFGEWLAGLNRD